MAGRVDRRQLVAIAGYSTFRHRRHQRVEDLRAVGHAQLRRGRALGMRHHAQDIPSFAADSGDVLERAVRIGFGGDFAVRRRIAEDDAVLVLQFGQSGLVAEVVAFHVADRDLQHFAFGELLREGSVGAFNANMHRLADVLQSRVAHQRAREQPGFAEDLETVADAEHQPAVSRELAHRFHHWRELGDGARPKVVSVGKPAGNDNGVAALQVRRIMPKERHGLAGDFRNGPIGIVIAIGTGEDNDAEFHTVKSPWSGKVEFSMAFETTWSMRASNQ